MLHGDKTIAINDLNGLLVTAARDAWDLDYSPTWGLPSMAALNQSIGVAAMEISLTITNNMKPVPAEKFNNAVRGRINKQQLRQECERFGLLFTENSTKSQARKRIARLRSLLRTRVARLETQWNQNWEAKKNGA